VIRLESTTGNAVAAAIDAERVRQGSSTTGMVLTLLVLASEDTQSDAATAASQAAREHPMRVIVFVPRPEGRGRGGPAAQSRIDAEIRVGGDEGPGELAVLRLRGPVAEHAASVAIPLLLPDTPVVAWWPGAAPESPADDPIGRHAVRRITDTAASGRPLQELRRRVDGYQPGDTDLAWTRLTHWRSLLASALDRDAGEPREALIRHERGSPSAPLLASWLHQRLGIPVRLRAARAPGISEVRLITTAGEVVVQRPTGASATFSAPGQAPATVALPRRPLAELLAEELRRLDPDSVYGEALLAVPDVLDPEAGPARPTPSRGRNR